jgi:acyl carrier protein
MDTLPSVIGIILEILGLSSFCIDESTTADDVPGWNSLSHANILMAIEEYFGIEFDLNVVLSAKNVGDLVAMIDGKRELN